jgi:uncharacterized protein (UPF0248 family)
MGRDKTVKYHAVLLDDGGGDDTASVVGIYTDGVQAEAVGAAAKVDAIERGHKYAYVSVETITLDSVPLELQYGYSAAYASIMADQAAKDLLRTRDSETGLPFFRVVAIEQNDGMTVWECGVPADDADDAEERYLRGEWRTRRPLEPEAEPFSDCSPAEYIKSIEPWDG